MSTAPQEKTKRTKKKLPTDCPHWGKGGSYLRNPVTGERTPAGQVHQVANNSVPAKSSESAIQSAGAKSAAANKEN